MSMFECRTCFVHCLRAIARDRLPINFANDRQLLQPSLLSRRPLRRHASTAIATKHISRNGLTLGKQPIGEDEVRQNESEVGSKNALTSSQKKHLELELRYLGDRVKFAEHVHYTLRCNKPEKALDLCRLASKSQEVVVAWNHCVDWHMQQNRIEDAIKIYNEMKKRAQFPDSYTYVLLLRGLAKRPPHHGPEARKDAKVAKAVSIYNSMSSPTSRVKPSIMHTNAVLRVCSAALDMDALWGVVAKLPSTGAGAPDHMTYSILLNAIRFSAQGDNPRDMSLEQIAARRNKAVQEGRQLWRDVIARWRSGEVKIDEDLICSMGKLLLISKDMQDLDDVLDLVQQTTKVERQIPPLGHPDRHSEHVPQDKALSKRQGEPEEDSEGYKDVPAVKAFHSVTPHAADPAHPKRPTTLAWTQPGNLILSILIEACTALRIPKTATAYWKLLTTEYAVEPDLENFHSQLQLLAINRSSAQAAALLKDGILAAGIEPKKRTFRIAMSVCARDKKNHNVLSNARTIIDCMEKTLPDLDIHTLIQYLNLALMTDDGPQIVSVLNRLDPLVHILRSRMSYGTEETGTMTPAQHVVDKEETVKFLQAMVGVIDTLMNRGLVPRNEYKDWHARRSILTEFIGRAKNSIEKQRGQLDTEEAEREARRAAKEAGRLVRQQKFEQQGKAEPRMSKQEWALKVFRRNEKRNDLRERNRTKAAGLLRWDVSQSRTSNGFADTGLELSEK